MRAIRIALSNYGFRKKNFIWNLFVTLKFGYWTHQGFPFFTRGFRNRFIKFVGTFKWFWSGEKSWLPPKQSKFLTLFLEWKVLLNEREDDHWGWSALRILEDGLPFDLKWGCQDWGWSGHSTKVNFFQFWEHL